MYIYIYIHRDIYILVYIIYRKSKQVRGPGHVSMASLVGSPAAASRGEPSSAGRPVRLCMARAAAVVRASSFACDMAYQV